MAAGPQRAAEPRRHLDAAIVPVERALLARAKAIEEEILRITGAETGEIAEPDDLAAAKALAVVAEEFHALAVELHYW